MQTDVYTRAFEAWKAFLCGKRTPFLSFCTVSLVCVSLSLLCGCGGKGRGSEVKLKEIAVRRATLLSMEEADSFTYVVVRNPWKKGGGERLAAYVLVPHDRPVPSVRPDGVLLRTPLRRAVVTTAVHAALLDELGALPRVAGVTEAEYIVSPSLREKLASGALPALGSAFRPDLERLRAAKADAMLVSPMENSGAGALAALSVPLVQCADYLETSPLGRAEWMRFYGRLFGCAEKSDSLFAAVESAYEDLRKKAADGRGKGTRPVVLCDLKTSAVWYQPAGKSTIGRMLSDAGAAHPWADTHESGSLALDLETVFAKASNADVWLAKYASPVPLTYKTMARDCPQYKLFRPWKARRVWGCNTLDVPFYEETPFHPERLLREWHAIFNGSTAPGRYYRPLSE